MTAKEVGTHIYNCLGIVGAVVLVAMGRMPWWCAVIAAVYLVSPGSAGPLLLAIKEAMTSQRPPNGASVIEKDGGK